MKIQKFYFINRKDGLAYVQELSRNEKTGFAKVKYVREIKSVSNQPFTILLSSINRTHKRCSQPIHETLATALFENKRVNDSVTSLELSN